MGCSAAVAGGVRASAAARASELKMRRSRTYLETVPGDCCVDEKKKESREKMSSRAAKWVKCWPWWWWFMVESDTTHSETSAMFWADDFVGIWVV